MGWKKSWAFPLACACVLGAWGCGSSDDSGPVTEVMEEPPDASSGQLLSGDVMFCGEPKATITGGHMTPSGGLIPNHLNGEVDTGDKELTINADISIDVFDLTHLTVTGGNAQYGDQKVTLSRSTIGLKVDGTTPKAVNGTVNAGPNCTGGIVLNASF